MNIRKIIGTGLLLAAPAAAQVVKATNPAIPAATSVFAQDGDLTYCVLTPRGAKPLFSLTCRRNGATYFTASTIAEDTVVTAGDLAWSLSWDPSNPLVVRFQASENVRDKSGVAISAPTAIGNFQLGEAVGDASGTKTGIVAHWGESVGSTTVDGGTRPSSVALLTLKSVSGSFSPGDVVSGRFSGASLVVAATSPIVANVVKSMGAVDWSSTSSRKIMLRKIPGAISAPARSIARAVRK